MSSLADLAAGHELVKAMQPAPVTRASIAPLIVVTLIPLVAVAVPQVPFKANLDSLKGLLAL